MDNRATYHIPTNFTDAGRVLGLFELRNVIEMALLTVPVVFLCIMLSSYTPFSMTTKIIISLFLIVPVGGFSLIGIRDDSLFRFLQNYFSWRKHRRILTWRGDFTA